MYSLIHKVYAASGGESDPQRLSARLQVLRRGQAAIQAPAELWLSLGLPRLGSGERSVGLSLEEQRLLEALARHGGVLPRGQLEALLWNDHQDAHPARLHRLAANVRRKLGEVGAEQTLETLRGFGYRLNQPLALREH
ncbi:MAG: hypothetical protein GAK43_02299 [Stenotrophomonas maltophilia]|nr:MAG: hypothetical protein GAK43_02299 [Stenotrophomonas maltophilia]